MKKKGLTIPRSLQRLFPNVGTVIDAKHPVKVDVTPADCKHSEPLNPRECALARAAKREYKADAVIIGMSTSYIIKGRKAVRFDTPEAVQRELVSFDRHSDFEPGEYELRPKPPSSRFGKKTRRASGTGGNHKPRRRVHHSARIRTLRDKQ